VKEKLAPRRAMNGAPGQVLRPVVAVDVDGTLGEYHEHFAEYAEMFLQKPVLRNWEGSIPYWRCFSVSKTRYREMKLGYRQGRMKRSMPVRPGAAALSAAVRAAGAELWVCTTRPWQRLDNIDPDTQFWLQRSHVRYDGVLYGESKYRDLRQLVGINRVVAVLDDEPEQVRKAEQLGLTARIMDRPYNQGGDFYRSFDLEQAAAEMVALIKQWRKENGV